MEDRDKSEKDKDTILGASNTTYDPASTTITKNPTITKTVFTDADSIKKDSNVLIKQKHIDELNNAISKLDTYLKNVSNCGYINCCQSCQDSCICQSSKCESCQDSCVCQSSKCQSCQNRCSCESCQGNSCNCGNCVCDD